MTNPLKFAQVDPVTNAVIASFVMPASLVDSFNQWIAAQQNPDGTPKYTSVWDLLQKHFVTSLGTPILQQYPTPDLAAALATAQQAQQTAATTALNDALGVVQ